MKEKYTTPEMKTIEFEVEDIITTSGSFDDDGPIELPVIRPGKK